VSEYAAAAAAMPITYAVNLLLALGTLALLIPPMIRTVSGWRGLRAPASSHADPDAARALLRRQGEAALVVVVVCYLAAMSLTRQRALFAIPRYLFPVFAGVPLIANQLLAIARWPRVHLPISLQTWARPLAPVALLALLGWNLAGIAA